MLDKTTEAAAVAVAAKVEAVTRDVKAVLAAMPADAPDHIRHRLQKALTTLERAETYIAVAGLFKAGKSTLLNRLARWAILPSRGLPETGAPALVRRRKPQAAWATDRSGRKRQIDATPEGIAQQTSLYNQDGVRRDTADMAAFVEVDAPLLDVSDNTVLIDLPGLRDTNEMDQVALEMALEADVIFWVFRSEPAFSEQDTEFLSYLIAACGAHLIQFVLNVVQSDKSAKAWAEFQKRQLFAHRSALTKASAELGLPPEKAQELCVVDASRMRKAWFGVTFGGRQMYKRLRSLSRRSDEQVKLARFVRVASALALCSAWLAPEQDEAERRFADEQARFETYQARLKRREQLIEEINQAVASAFSGVESEIRGIGDSAAGQVSRSGFSVGAEMAGPLIGGGSSVILTRAKRLVAALTAIANDSELDGLSVAAADEVIAAFALGQASGTAAEKISRSVEGQVGSIRTGKPKLSFGRLVSWVKGQDSEVDAVIDSTRSALRSAASQLGAKAKAREAEVRVRAQRLLKPSPLAPVAPPDPKRITALRQYRKALDSASNKVQLRT